MKTQLQHPIPRPCPALLPTARPPLPPSPHNPHQALEVDGRTRLDEQPRHLHMAFTRRLVERGLAILRIPEGAGRTATSAYAPRQHFCERAPTGGGGLLRIRSVQHLPRLLTRSSHTSTKSPVLCPLPPAPPCFPSLLSLSFHRYPHPDPYSHPSTKILPTGQRQVTAHLNPMIYSSALSSSPPTGPLIYPTALPHSSAVNHHQPRPLIEPSHLTPAPPT